MRLISRCFLTRAIACSLVSPGRRLILNLPSEESSDDESSLRLTGSSSTLPSIDAVSLFSTLVWAAMDPKFSSTLPPSEWRRLFLFGLLGGDSSDRIVSFDSTCPFLDRLSSLWDSLVLKWLLRWLATLLTFCLTRWDDKPRPKLCDETS